MVEVGDVIEITTRKVGQVARKGTVKTVQGALITVVWDSGDETKLIPAAGSLIVVEAVAAGALGIASPAASGNPRTPGQKESKKKAAGRAGKAKPGPKGGKRR
jgi:hypothetical protein